MTCSEQDEQDLFQLQLNRMNRMMWHRYNCIRFFQDEQVSVPSDGFFNWLLFSTRCDFDPRNTRVGAGFSVTIQ